MNWDHTNLHYRELYVHSIIRRYYGYTCKYYDCAMIEWIYI